MKKIVRITRCISILLLVLCLVVLLAHGEAMAIEKTVKVKTSIVGDPVCFDPARASHTPDLAVNYNVLQGLVAFDFTAEPPFPIIPRLAKSYEVSKDGKTITFMLNRGVQFHHGYGEFTSEDVIFSLERHLDPKIASLAKNQMWDMDHIEAPDKYTVKIYLKHSTAQSFLGSLAWTKLGHIISKKAAAKLGKEVENLPIGTGPYYFDNWKSGEKVVIKKFDDYWRTPAKIDVIEFWIVPEEIVSLGAIEKGDLDIVKINQLGSYRKAKSIKGIYIKEGKASSWQYLLFINHKKKPMDDVRVRRALAHALDLKAISERIGPLLISFPSPLPPSVTGATDKFWTYDYNLDKARQLLEEAGYPNGFKLKMIYKKGSLYEPIALEVKNYWDKVVDVELTLVDKGVFTKTIKEYKHHVVEWARARFVPYLYAQGYETDNAQNYSKYSNREVDEAIKKALMSRNKEEARKNWWEFQRLVTNDVVNIVPGVGTSLVAIRNKLKGVEVCPFTGIYNFEKAYIE